jgi:PAS domain S-box-containing protein
MTDGMAPAGRTDVSAVVVFPEQVDERTAAEAGDQLVAAFRRGAEVVVADLSGTTWCDQAGVEALMRAYRYGVICQAELRLVVSAPAVGQLVREAGLDRLVPVYPLVHAALDHGVRGDSGPLGESVLGESASGLRLAEDVGSPPKAAVNAAVLRQLIDALNDGIVLADDEGTIVLASRRLTEMFGYEHGELVGQPVEALVPAGLRESHRLERVGYAMDPVNRPMAERTRLVGVRKDGTTVPVAITLSPVPTTGGHLVLAVVRDVAREARREDLASLAWAAASDLQQDSRELLHTVVSSMFQVGLSLQAAAVLPAEVARERISQALIRLDEVIHEIRDHVFRPRQAGTDGTR